MYSQAEMRKIFGWDFLETKFFGRANPRSESSFTDNSISVDLLMEVPMQPVNEKDRSQAKEAVLTYINTVNTQLAVAEFILVDKHYHSSRLIPLSEMCPPIPLKQRFHEQGHCEK